MRLFLRAMLCVALAIAAAGRVAATDTGVDYRLPDTATETRSSSSFNDWYRYPAEERAWLAMAGATAYTRDVLAGGETFISGASDGEYWHADAQSPTGGSLTWGNIQFFADYGGQSNCFVSPFWAICNTTSIYILWYSNAQCAQPGDWTMNFYANGSQFFGGQYTLLPQIPPNKVPVYDQGAYSDAYDSICRTGTQRDVFPCDGRPGEVSWTIGGKGCYMTSGAMILGYHGVNVTPPALNTWLTSNGGYDLRGNVYPDAIARYARDVAGTQVAYLGRGGDLDSLACTYGPQMIGVKSNTHWVTATGEDAPRTTHLINDPDGGLETTVAARYGNQFQGIRGFGGPEYTYTDITGIVIRFHSPGELLVTDPLGRVTGFDPTTGQLYEEIPGSGYSYVGLADEVSGDPGPLSVDLDIRRPVAGEYLLDVLGTGTGTYDLEINALDPAGSPSQVVYTDMPIFPGAIHSYTVDYTKTVGDEVETGGGFDGGGQRPRDVNKFLSYGSPGQRQTDLPPGVTTFDLLVFYGETTLPETFSAVLNGLDIAAMFAPAPGGGELVELNLDPGRNTLVLSIEGQLPNRIATDTDRLIFIVQ